MNDNANWSELARLPIAKMQDVMLARFVGRDAATTLGFTPAILTRIATAISEITRNVVQHAGAPGEIRLGRISTGARQGLRIIVSDTGKGIEHAERFLEEGKVGTLGAGLPGTRRLVNHFDIQTASGSGTTVTMDLWTQEDAL